MPVRRRRLLLLPLALAALALALTLAGGGAAAASGPKYAGIEVTNPKPEPPLVLRNYTGNPVNLASFRGNAVLVTFIYTHCPDTCPLIVSKLHTAQTQMSASERKRLQIVAVSVDPRGDTRATVAHFLKVHRMTGRMLYLIGSSQQLLRVWSAWGIASQHAKNTPDLVEHTALIYGITGHGRIAVVYPANFSVQSIVHDARLLAGA